MDKKNVVYLHASIRELLGAFADFEKSVRRVNAMASVERLTDEEWEALKKIEDRRRDREGEG